MFLSNIDRFDDLVVFFTSNRSTDLQEFEKVNGKTGSTHLKKFPLKRRVQFVDTDRNLNKEDDLKVRHRLPLSCGHKQHLRRH